MAGGAGNARAEPALEAERAAERSRADAEAQRNEAQRQTAVAEAVNRFLTEDLLAAASPERERDPQITVRAVLDRAAGAIGDRFEQQPLVEGGRAVHTGGCVPCIGGL